jgi:hypothetical protein
MVTEAVRLPLAVGVNMTLIVQLLPAPTELPHVFVSAKSPAFAPVIAMLDRLKAALPVLLRVMVWGALVEPTAWFPKARLVGERLTLGSNGGGVLPPPPPLPPQPDTKIKPTTTSRSRHSDALEPFLSVIV